MILVDMIKDDWRPKYGKAGDAKKDWKGVERVEVSFVGCEVAKIALSVLGDTKNGPDLGKVIRQGVKKGYAIRTR
jgi:hypothetical protein